MKNLVVLPTLDGSKEASVARLDAWLLQPARRAMLENIHGNPSRYWRVADQLDRVDLVLGAAS